MEINKCTNVLALPDLHVKLEQSISILNMYKQHKLLLFVYYNYFLSGKFTRLNGFIKWQLTKFCA